MNTGMDQGKWIVVCWTNMRISVIQKGKENTPGMFKKYCVVAEILNN